MGMGIGGVYFRNTISKNRSRSAYTDISIDECIEAVMATYSLTSLHSGASDADIVVLGASVRPLLPVRDARFWRQVQPYVGVFCTHDSPTSKIFKHLLHHTKNIYIPQIQLPCFPSQMTTPKL